MIRKSAKKDLNLGVFGDTKLNPIRESKKRLGYMEGVQKIIRSVNLKEVFIVPTQGVCIEFLTAIRAHNIPYTLVIPYTGYCDHIDLLSKLNLKFGVKDAKSVVIVGSPPKSIHEHAERVQEAEDFIFERSDIVLSIFGDKSKQLVERRNNKILASKLKHIIFLNYDSNESEI